uniref:Uncharacterized protein n=1 Tax=Davidia involucrata TaxID=16924 RepID=A0A5B6YZP6_DAVIN
MADPTKHIPINGGTLFSDLKGLFSLFRTKKSMAFAYGFMFAFIAFTIFLAFNPSSNSYSPWFTNIFTSSSSATTSTTLPPTNFSFFFPNPSQQFHNLTSSTSQTNTSRSQNITSPNINKEPTIIKNQTQNPEFHLNNWSLEAKSEHNWGPPKLL